MGTSPPRSAHTRPRPPIFRALGAEDPPLEVEIDGETSHLLQVLKHDSWAATALYENSSGKIICKFNRTYPLGILPMQWLGRLLARREARALQILDDLPNVPRLAGCVALGGSPLSCAIARVYIPGRPLRERERVNDQFFPALQTLLQAIHRRNMAYVDMHKHENIIVGPDGQPYLIDFQISVILPQRWPGSSKPMQALLCLLQRSDIYHLRKLYARSRPDLCGFDSRQIAAQRPWWIRLHRLVAVPFRRLRRQLLVMLRIRSGRGYAASEHFPEDAVRNQSEPAERDTKEKSSVS